MTHKLYINAHFIVSFAFPVNNSKLSNSKCAHGAQFKTQNSKFKLSPIQELEPDATPFAVVGVALLAILTDRQQPENKKKIL